LTVIQLSNGQGPGEHRKPKGVRHNGKLCPTDKKQAIINGLAAGKSKRSIARDCGASHSTVDAIEEQEWAQVGARKQVLAAKHERAAILALDELLDRLETKPSEISTPVLNIIGGTSTDKAMLLRGENMQNIHHLHSIELSDSDIVAYALLRSKTVQAAVVEVPALHGRDPSARGKNGAQKEG
jgi:hypothetical protein